METMTGLKSLSRARGNTAKPEEAKLSPFKKPCGARDGGGERTGGFIPNAEKSGAHTGMSRANYLDLVATGMVSTVKQGRSTREIRLSPSSGKTVTKRTGTRKGP